MRNAYWKTTCAAVALAAMLQNTAAFADVAAGPVLVAQPSTGTAGAAQLRDPASITALSTAAKVALLRQKVKYVFVLFQENRAFDHYFGTFPGVDGLFTAGVLNNVPGAVQQIRNTDGSYGTISPFLIPRTITDVNGQPVALYPEDIYSVDHSHSGMANGMHFDQATRKIAANDSYALDNEGLGIRADGVVTTNPLNSASPQPPTANPTLATKQKGEVVMAHVDCDTIPFLWQWADRFTLFDNMHQTTIGPSTPNAIAMIAGQSGETQWALHPSLGNAYNSGATRTGANGATYTKPAFPIIADPGPYPGSSFDSVANPPPYNPGDENPANPAINLTSATLPLSFMGNQIGRIIAADQNPRLDLLDVQHDILTVASKNPHVNWTWYEQGYGAEPFDTAATGAHPVHSSYIVHHEGPQYFGYIADNTTEQQSLKSLGSFYSDMANRALPASGGVFYVRGGYYNQDNLTPIDPSPAVQANFAGNDDHGSYSDSQISETNLADSVNAIANSPYWSQSAIIITYDETDGFYDHAQPQIRSFDPAGVPLTGGPRIPLILISPFAAAHTVSKQYSEHSSVIKFIDTLFNLVPLADLPDEAHARTVGQTELGQSNLGPADDQVANMGGLLEAFDNDRLLGNVAALPASYATIPPAVNLSFPHYHGAGCHALGITPTDYMSDGTIADPPPLDFNPRPTVSPGVPYLEITTNPSTGATVSTPWTP